MNKLGAIAIALFLTCSAAEAASIQRVSVFAQLGDDGLTVNEAYNNGTVSGYFEIDLDDLQVTTFGNDSLYMMTDWDVRIASPTGAPTLINRSSGDPADRGLVLLDRSANAILIVIDEDIDDPATEIIEDRSLNLRFVTTFDIIIRTSFMELLSADPEVGTPSSFDVGLLQFSTGQIPTTITAASFSATVVPLPAPFALLVTGLFATGLLGLRRRYRQAA